MGQLAGFMALLASQLIIKMLLPQEEGHIFLSLPFLLPQSAAEVKENVFFSTPPTPASASSNQFRILVAQSLLRLEYSGRAKEILF